MILLAVLACHPPLVEEEEAYPQLDLKDSGDFEEVAGWFILAAKDGRAVVTFLH